MVAIGPFVGRTVSPEWLNRMPSPAYDSLSTAQRQQYRANNPWSYLNVTRAPEDELPGMPTDNASLVAAGRTVLDGLLSSGAFGPETEPVMYLYRLRTDDHEQTAIVAEAEVAGYSTGEIRVHEQIRAVRAELLADHMITVAHTSSPIALTFKSNDEIGSLIEQGQAAEPILEWSDGTLHQTVWVVDDDLATELRRHLEARRTYIIDGHHRAAAAHTVTQRPDAPAGSKHMLVALFPDDALQILGFNRVVRGMDDEVVIDVLAQLHERYEVRAVGSDAPEPEKGTLAVFAQGSWHLVDLGTPAATDPLSALDPVRLQNEILGPILGITEAGHDLRLETVSGDQDVADLEDGVRTDGGIAFVVAPLTVDDLFAVANADQTMPPKSTYFVPKVRSGIFLRPLG